MSKEVDCGEDTLFESEFDDVSEEPYLTLMDAKGAAATQVYRAFPGYVIGRDPEADVQIPNRSVSRQHARFVREGGRWAVEDLVSHNGTRVNGKKITHQVLRSGDELRLGDCRYYVLFERGAELVLDDEQPRPKRSTSRVKRELEKAGRAQADLLPRLAQHGGLDIAARMLPTDEVGGDYYDLLPTEDGGCWLAIGDVAGHGLSAGMVMMMLQSAVATATKRDPWGSPSNILSLINGVLHANVRERLGKSQHVTLLLMRHLGEGEFRYAGAHEEILVHRAKSKQVEVLATHGTFLGALPDVSHAFSDEALTLEVGDRMLLFTDGVVDLDRDGDRFATARLQDLLRDSAAGSVGEALDATFAALAAHDDSPDDDMTLVIVERTR